MMQRYAHRSWCVLLLAHPVFVLVTLSVCSFVRLHVPRSWATQKKLVNLSGNPAQRSYGVEYKGKVYYPAGPEEAALFLKDPEQVLSGEPFPAPAKLPLRLLPADVLECGGKLALKGFCPVSLLEVRACVCLCV